MRRPRMLKTRTTGDVLLDIQSGAWQEKVAHVRSLPSDSKEQESAKVELPYCTWSGVFHYRSNSALSKHSGQVGVDLDRLGWDSVTTVLQTAMTDTYCLAAYRSVRGEGVRLLFRIPPCSTDDHVIAFEQVARHVKAVYGHEPDQSGKDVSRASFISFDNGLWFKGNAKILPIQISPGLTQRLAPQTRCVNPAIYAGRLAMTCWDWYGRNLADASPRADGFANTHRSLLELGKGIAMHAERIRVPLTEHCINEAFNAWLAEHARQGVGLRRAVDEYRRELAASVEGARRKSWFKPAVEKWIRWTRCEDFPRHPYARILFAIRKHCEDSGSNEFFIGARDAGMVGGVSFVMGARLLLKLAKNRQIEKLGERSRPRHAQTYRLLPHN